MNVERICRDCKKPFQSIPTVKALNGSTGEYEPISYRARCEECYQAYRKRNRAVYPMCNLCQRPAHYSDFLKRYRDVWPDTIKICCNACAGQFLAMSEEQQKALVRLACSVTFGTEQYIYQIANPETTQPFYIGRSKDAAKRFKEHLRELARPKDTYAFLPEEKPYSSHDMMRDLLAPGVTPGLAIIEKVTPGAHAVEREIRHILNGIQRNWPLLNREASNENITTSAQESIDFLKAPYDEMQAHFQPFQFSPQIALIRYAHNLQ